MSRRLKDQRREPVSGRTENVVIFLHGYGADGADLLGLADPLAPHLKNTVFRAPDAPEQCRGNPFGWQWFPISRMDGSSPAEQEAGFQAARADLHAYLDRVMAEEQVGAGRIALVGFSQGTMMSLAVAPERETALAAVVGFSGRLVDPEQLPRALSKPPVLLVHGDRDEMVPFSELAVAANALVESGFETYSHVMKGTGHGIAPDGLSVALAFLKDKLPGSKG